MGFKTNKTNFYHIEHCLNCHRSLRLNFFIVEIFYHLYAHSFIFSVIFHVKSLSDCFLLSISSFDYLYQLIYAYEVQITIMDWVVDDVD